MSYVPLPSSVPRSRQVLVDFGATLVREGIFVVADAGVTPSSKLTGNVAYVATADHSLDEVQCDAFDVKIDPGTGTFTIYLRALLGTVWGKYYVNYTVSAG